MLEAIVVRPDVVVPSEALSFRAVRASGPGGQNVNKVASKIELRVELARIVGLAPDARERLRRACENALDAEGRLVVVSQVTRDQRRNLDDAREKVRVLVARALPRPRLRRSTKPTRGSVERRLSEKKHRARTKAGRGGRDD